MPTGRHRPYKERNYAVGQRLLTLRTKTRLTQAELAAQAGVHRRSIQNWETGAAYPREEGLQGLIAVFLAEGAFTPGEERIEAETLWQQVSQDAPRPLALFDATWFTGLAVAQRSPPAVDPAPEPAAQPILTPQPAPAHLLTRSPRLDWGEAIDVPALYGRDEELATLATWALADRCRVIGLLGLGGIGKTTLALAFAHHHAGHFEAVIFRSLRNAPPIGELLDDLIHIISAQPATPHEHAAGKIERLVGLLRERRSLLILDNAETIMQEDAQAGRFRAGYTDYGRLIARLGETQHQGCLLLTSREKPIELGPLESRSSPVRTLLLRGLDESACHAVLEDRDLFGAEADWSTLARIYSGNPLALKLVSEPIREIFGGAIAAFLQAGDAFFNGVGKLLEAQFARSMPLEQTLLLWLAIARDLAPLDVLLADLAGTAGQREVLQGLESLRRRSLIERAEGRPAFTLQPVVLEYLTTRVVEAITAELIAGQFELLCSHGLSQAMAKEYVRQSQMRMLVTPVLERLRMHYRSDVRLAAMFHQHLETLRAMPPEQQRYGGSNLATLLAQHQGHLRGANLAGLALWNVSFAGMAMQDANLRETRFDRVALTDTSDVCFDVAASPEGQHLAAAMPNGVVRIWRASDLTPVANCTGHTAPVWAIAFRPSPPGGPTPGDVMLASGGFDGMVRLWAVPEGTGLGALAGHQEYVWDVAWHPCGMILASAGEDGTVRLWDIAGGVQRAVLAPTGAGAAYALAWRPDGLALASGHADGSIRLWIAEPGTENQEPRTMLRAAQPNVKKGEFEGAAPQEKLSHIFMPVGAAQPHGTTNVKKGEFEGAAPQEKLSHIFMPVGAAQPYGTTDTGQTIVDQLQERAVLRGHNGPVWALAWAPGGATLASAGADTTIRLWDENVEAQYTVPLQERAVLRGHSGLILALAWHPNGRLLASGSADYSVRLWESADGSARTVMEGHSGSVGGIAFAPDGAVLASGGEDQTIRLWDLPSGQPRTALVGYSQWAFALAWSVDGRLASAGSDRVVQIWDILAANGTNTPEPHLRESLDGHSNWVHSIAFSPDGRQLASGALDGTVRLWDIETSQVRLALHGHGGFAAAAWSTDGHLLASAGTNRAIVIWDAASGARLRTLEGHTETVWSVAWRPGAGPAWLASASNDHTIIIWDATAGIRLRTLEGHTSFVRCVAWHPNVPLLASCGADGSVRLWDAASGAGLATLHGHTNDVRAVAWHPGGALLASASEDGTIRLWELAAPPGAWPTGQGEQPFPESFADRITERVVLRSDTGQVRSVAWSPDGTLLASCGEGGWIVLWDIAAALGRAGTTARLAQFRGDRPYERMRIGGASGLTPAQRATLLALGAIE